MSNLAEVGRKLNPQHFFPYEFLRNVQEKTGKPVVLSIRTKGSLGYIKFYVKNESEPFAKYRIEADPNDEKVSIIEDLRLEDPSRRDQGGLNFSQSSKGLPPKVFNFAKRKLFEFLRAGGFEKLLSNSARNYVVSLLYEKLVGMKPANQLTLSNMNAIYRLWTEKVGHLPEDIKPKNLEEFAVILGEGYSVDAEKSGLKQSELVADTSILALINRAESETKMVQQLGGAVFRFVTIENVTVWFDEGNSAFAVYLQNESKLLFIDQVSQERRILRWSRIIDEGANMLVLNLREKI